MPNIVSKALVTIFLLTAASSAKAGFDEPAEYKYLSNPVNAKNADFRKRLIAYFAAPWYEEKRTLVSSELVQVQTDDQGARSDRTFQEQAGIYGRLYNQAANRVGIGGGKPGQYRTENGFLVDNYFSEEEKRVIGKARNAMWDTYFDLRKPVTEVRNEYRYQRRETTNLGRSKILLQLPHITQRADYPTLILKLHANGRYKKGRQIVQGLMLELGYDLKALRNEKILVGIAKQALLDKDTETFEAILQGFENARGATNIALKKVAELCLDNMQTRLNVFPPLAGQALNYFSPNEIKQKWITGLRKSIDYTMTAFNPTANDYQITGYADLKKRVKFDLEMFRFDSPKLFQYLMTQVFVPYQIQMVQQIEEFKLANTYANNFGLPSFYRQLKRDPFYAAMIELAPQIKKGGINYIAKQLSKLDLDFNCGDGLQVQ